MSATCGADSAFGFWNALKKPKPIPTPKPSEPAKRKVDRKKVDRPDRESPKPDRPEQEKPAAKQPVEQNKVARQDNELTPAAACPRSFDPDTPVLMADGTTRPTGEVNSGDVVATTDPQTGSTAISR